jgi:hypothetical protein
MKLKKCGNFLKYLRTINLPPGNEPTVHTIYQRMQFDKITLAWLWCWPFNCTGLWTLKPMYSQIVFYWAQRLCEGIPQTLHWHILNLNNFLVNTCINSIVTMSIWCLQRDIRNRKQQSWRVHNNYCTSTCTPSNSTACWTANQAIFSLCDYFATKH